MYNTPVTTGDEAAILALLDVYGLLFFVTIIIAIIGYTGRALLFKKSGREWWEAIIPVYNIVIMHNMTFGKEKWPFILLMLVPYVNIVYGIYFYVMFAKAYNLTTIQQVFFVFFPFIMVWYMALNDNIHYEGEQKHIF